MQELKSKFDAWFLNDSSDQKRGLPAPAVEKPYANDAELIKLPIDYSKIDNIFLIDAMSNRKTHRKFSGDELSLTELSFILWATQGVRDSKRPQFRMVPSGGARHPFETYLVILNVAELKPGLYRYLPVEHCLYCVELDQKVMKKLQQVIPSANPVAPGLASSAVTFIWTAIPYRTEWRYTGMGTKLIAQDAGHLCQNLYLAVEAINSGTCAVDAYFQKEADHLLGLEGQDEFTVYMAVVGKI